MPAKQYVVLIGDIVQSRSLENRGAVQRKFSAACAKLNAEADKLGLLSPLTVTLGDEFQAVFKGSGKLWECIFRLEAALAPLPIRFALGVGPITTAIRRDSALGMDGPAFYAARAAMDQLKKGNGRYRVAGLPQEEQFINAALALLAASRLKWRPSRLLVLANLLQGKAISDITRLTKTSEQAVYRNIRDGSLDAVIALVEGISLKIDAALR